MELRNFCERCHKQGRHEKVMLILYLDEQGTEAGWESYICKACRYQVVQVVDFLNFLTAREVENGKTDEFAAAGDTAKAGRAKDKADRDGYAGQWNFDGSLREPAASETTPAS